jgi:hypothetical protein
MVRNAKQQEDRTNGGPLGFEAQLWQAADALRGSMDAAEYKHVVLFLKYISDAFEEQHTRLESERAQGADPEDPDEYRAVNIFWVPAEARWPHLKAQAKQSTIGQLVDDAMTGGERDNPSLKGVLPKDYARPALDKHRLGQLIDVISNIRVGDEESRSRDVLGPGLRILSFSVCQRRGQERRRVLHTPLHRSSASRDARAIQGAGVRPLLRLVGDVRPVHRVHPRSCQRKRERGQS